MIRWKILAASAAVIAGAVFITGASAPHRPPVEAPAPRAKPVDAGQKVGYFNMDRTLVESNLGKKRVKALQEQRIRMSANLIGLQEMYKELKKASEGDNSGILVKNGKYWKEQQARVMLPLAQRIQNLESEINKRLNDQASVIIDELHDEIRVATVEMARDHGLAAVITFPDGRTAEEQNTPQVKDGKMKMTAAYPFYLDPSVDYTQELIDRVNAKFAADNEGK
jgi:Skp family chaperone for outer membrane proteins